MEVVLVSLTTRFHEVAKATFHGPYLPIKDKKCKPGAHTLIMGFAFMACKETGGNHWVSEEVTKWVGVGKTKWGP